MKQKTKPEQNFRKPSVKSAAEELAELRPKQPLDSLSPLGVSIPPSISSKNMLQMQRLIGNQAVIRLKGEEKKLGDDLMEPDFDSKTHVDYSDEAIDIILGRLEANTSPVPPMEVISATTSSELSVGELEQEIEQSWKREKLSFTSAARMAAKENKAHQNQGGAIATQTPEFKPDQPYSKRWQLGLYAHDYKKWSDLPDIKRLLKKGSPFQQSLGAEFDKVMNVNNPTSVQIRTETLRAIAALNSTLGENEIGELVVFFSGHSAYGSIAGVDDKTVDPDALADIASFAKQLRVHIIFVLDTCMGGYLTKFAHAEAAEKMEKDISALAEGDRESSEKKLALYKKLAEATLEMKKKAIYALYHSRVYWKKRTQANNAARMDSIMMLVQALKSFGLFLKSPGVSEDQVPGLAGMMSLTPRVNLGVFWALRGKKGEMMSILSDIAELLDMANDSQNEMLLKLNEEIKAAGSKE